MGVSATPAVTGNPGAAGGGAAVEATVAGYTDSDVARMLEDYMGK